MSADEHSVGNSLAAMEHAQIDRICTAFENAWRQGETPELEDCLHGWDAPPRVRALLFAELLALEVDYRRSRGQLPSSADYQARFPEYAEQVAEVFQKSPARSKSALLTLEPPAPPISFQDTLSSADPAASSDSRKQRSGAGPRSPNAPTHFGRYEVLRELGRGAFGRVYLGRDPQLDRQVAIKVARCDLFSSDENAARFLSEARKAAQVGKHPGIVTLYDVQRQGEIYYLVMDYIEGGTLDDRTTTGKLTQVEIIELVARVAEAVHFAHTHGLVHCDLKPANILIDGNGEPKVADFGLAVLESDQSHRKEERAGTPKYMSPEQVLGHVERLDGRTDIWSLGATLYELLTRRPPFSGATREDLFDQILHRDVKPPRQINDRIPAALERICLRALSKQPADRYSTARDFARDLRQVALPPSLRRLRQLAWLLGGLVLILIGVLLVVSLDDGGSRPVPHPSGPSPAPFVAPPHAEREFVLLPELHPSAITRLAASGRHVVSCDEDGGAWLWDLSSRKPVGKIDAPRGLWQVGLSGNGQLLGILLEESPHVLLSSIPDLTRIQPGPYTGSSPGLLLPVADQRSVWAVVPAANALRILEFPVGNPKYTCPVGGSWSCLAGAQAQGCLVVAGFVAEEQKWRVVKWRPGESAPDEATIAVSGAVCSVALSGKGKVAVGGYGPDVGVQVCLPGKPALRLDADKPDDRLYYHTVAISAEEDYIFAISRYIPPPGDPKQEHAVLRVWSITSKTSVADVSQPCVREEIRRPVDAVEFLPEQQRFLLATGHTVEVWSLK